MKKHNFSEEYLRNRFVEKFYIPCDIAIYLEVPVFSRSVDLVIQEMDSESLTAVEFKLNDWKRAILQVQSVGLCFDFLYICVPCPKTASGRQVIEQTCKQNGVGLFLYDFEQDEFIRTVTAVKTSKVWDAQKQRIISYLEDKKNE